MSMSVPHIRIIALALQLATTSTDRSTARARVATTSPRTNQLAKVNNNFYFSFLIRLQISMNAQTMPTIALGEPHVLTTLVLTIALAPTDTT